MDKNYSNPCTRCGRERVSSKSWKERTKTFSGIMVEVIHTETICPNPECQIIVEEDLAVQKEKRDKIKRGKEERLNLANKNKLAKSQISKL